MLHSTDEVTKTQRHKQLAYLCFWELEPHTTYAIVKLQPHTAPVANPLSFPPVPFPGLRLLGKVKRNWFRHLQTDASPSCWLRSRPPLIPAFGSSSIPLHQTVERDTAFALPQRKCFMGWHLATSAISVSSSMTQTGSNSNGLAMPPPQALPVQQMAPPAGGCGRGQ